MSSLLKKLSRWRAELESSQREILYATVFLLGWLGFGAFGYRVLEGWSLVDGLYMTFITLTTIGFGEVYPLSLAGRWFTIVIAFIGIGSVAFVAARWARILLLGYMLRQRQITRKIKKMRDHFIICGYGRVGRRMVANLMAQGKPIVVLDRNDELIQALHAEGIPGMLGDASDEDTLHQAGIAVAKGLITLLPTDSANVFVTLIARELNPDLFILARTTYTRNRRTLLQAGASEVVAPSDVGADRMAQVILRPSVDRLMSHVMEAADASLLMEEVIVQPGSFLADSSLANAHFRQNFNAIVIAVINGFTGEMTFNPSPHNTIGAGDVLVVLGSKEWILRVSVDGCSPKQE